MKRRLLLLGLLFFLFSCGSNNSGKEQKENAESVVKKDTLTTQTPKINVDSIVKLIEAENSRIESNLKSFKKTTLKTAGLREAIKQKWSVIDYYTENSQLVKIVTLPYKQITRRTEEFTFKNGKLILAVIADNGIDEKGNIEKEINKEYYYADDKCIKEDNRSKEKETTIRDSDNERLLQEAREYIDLLPKK